MESPHTIPGPADAAADSLGSIFVRFLRFGLLAWGGPVAQIAMVRDELVERERWVDPSRFNRVMAVYQALPGPEAHELCVYLGYVRRGRLGGLLAGLGFMLPGFVLMLAFSVAYVEVGVESTLAGGLFYGFAPAVAALVLRAVHRIGSHVLADRWLWLVAAMSAAGQLAGVHFALLLAGGGAFYAIATRARTAATITLAVVLGAMLALAVVDDPPVESAVAGPEASELREPQLAEVATAGLRAGLLTFGGAYTAIPFVERDAVSDGEWITRSQFLDGLAIASALPAPLVIFTTFVGYVGGGAAAALLMTVLVFAPAFAFTLLGHRHLERVVEHPGLHALLDGVTAAVVGLMALVAVTLVVDAVPDLVAAAIFVAVLVVMHVWRARLAIVAAMLGSGLAGAAWLAAG